MNENSHTDSSGGRAAPTVALGFVLGALVGAGLALLFAPARGEHTRRRLADAGRRLGGAARDTLDQARGAAMDLKQDAAAALDAGREAFEHGRRSHGPRTVPTDPPSNDA